MFDYKGLGDEILSCGLEKGLVSFFGEEGEEGFAEKVLYLEKVVMGTDSNLEQLMKSAIYEYLLRKGCEDKIEDLFQPILDEGSNYE